MFHNPKIKRKAHRFPKEKEDTLKRAQVRDFSGLRSRETVSQGLQNSKGKKFPVCKATAANLLLNYGGIKTHVDTANFRKSDCYALSRWEKTGSAGVRVIVWMTQECEENNSPVSQGPVDFSLTTLTQFHPLSHGHSSTPLRIL